MALVADQPADDIAVPNEIAPMEFDIPTIPEVQAAEPAPSNSATDPLDFDLSDISLELDGSDAGSKLEFEPESNVAQSEQSWSEDAASSSDAEMATKLDLALAYQEIGDKEGARELLDEVLKGGTAEQSERAKALLLELA
jgi:pilus assembly protein FimV